MPLISTAILANASGYPLNTYSVVVCCRKYGAEPFIVIWLGSLHSLTPYGWSFTYTIQYLLIDVVVIYSACVNFSLLNVIESVDKFPLNNASPIAETATFELLTNNARLLCLKLKFMF